ncbi:Uncharacterized membrane protein YccF, DUF307 family [Pleomorphomonas diazotrophica]|nr:YccF domain-containing protein [Pleomorphomonas diazotrophica]SFM95773.1 Uncharacterized membrane protein YccF, DUF307 family [Pleomorphomonas diazotrophica]
MHFTGRFVWFALGGSWTAMIWLLGAAVAHLIVGGQPLAKAAIEMAGLSILPFGREAVHIRELGGQDPAPTTTAARLIGPALNVAWLLTFGLVLCAAYLVLGVLCCLTVRAIPLGRQCFRLAGLSLWPVGQRVISTDLATVPRQQAAVERFARTRLLQSSQSDRIGPPRDLPPAAAN